MSDGECVFRREYDRINRDVYEGALPPFPGVEIVNRRDVFSMTRTFGAGRWRVLRSFLLSSHVKGELILECARHEIAHAAALLFDEDEGHGPAWQEHAQRCGARVIETLGEGDPMRRDW
ncbi:MAG: SprT-like domain-containing protein [Thermoplasmatota archaeon]